MIFSLDTRITAWIQQRRNRTTDRIARIVKPLGDGRNTIPALVVLYLYGQFAPDALAKLAAYQATISFLLTGAVAQTMQFFSHRQRPSFTPSPDLFEGPNWRSRARSYPSGHASAAFSVFSVIGLVYLPVAAPVAVLAFLLALLTALSRLNDHAHWPSDVLTGSLLGYAMATLAVEIPLRF